MQQEIQLIQQFLQSTFSSAGKKQGVIAVSGGIDSAVSCTLLTQALGFKSVFPVILPYGDQSTKDSTRLLDWLQIPESNRRMINIKPVVEELRKTIGLSSEVLDQIQVDGIAGEDQYESLTDGSDVILKKTQIMNQVQDSFSDKSVLLIQHDKTDQNMKILDPCCHRGRQVRNVENKVWHDISQLRLGNLMARTRMMFLFDVARLVDGLVCGTENKSEKYLGYFTRFGDEASDIEPIQHLYKTQIYELARELQMPAPFLEKAPSAGLWPNQTDEKELGFSYAVADQVLEVIVDRRPELLEKLIFARKKGVSERKQIVAKIARQVRTQIDELQSNAEPKNNSLLGERDILNSRSIHYISEFEIVLVLNRVQTNWFKQEAPYQITDTR